MSHTSTAEVLPVRPEPNAIEPVVMCSHDRCRCQRSAELASEGRILDAIHVHEALVRCRAPGPVWAP